MKREIEAKIHLTDDEFLKILNMISAGEDDKKIRRSKSQSLSEKKSVSAPAKKLSTENLKILFKTDEYFSQYDDRTEREKNEPRVIRLRTEKSENADGLNGKRFSKISEVNEFLEKIKSRKPDSEKSSDATRCQAEHLKALPAEKSDSATENVSASEKNLTEEKSYFTIKNKRFENGTEINCEDETLVENPEVLRNFFKATRFEKWFSKEKTSFSFFVKQENELRVQDGFFGQDKDSVQNQEPVLSRRENVPLLQEVLSPSQDFVQFQAELEIVNGLKYLEIECTDEKIPEKIALCALDEIFSGFALDVSKKDIRSWVEIIQNLPENKNQGSKNADA